MELKSFISQALSSGVALHLVTRPSTQRALHGRSKLNNLRKAIDAHPLPWFFGALLASFGAGVGAYQAVLSWSGMKVVRDEASSKLAIRIEASPAGAKIALNGDAEKFFQGMSLPEGLNVLSRNTSRRGSPFHSLGATGPGTLWIA
jgi:hypothetical protein